MKVKLNFANDKKNEVEIDIHDRVKISEWDGIVVEGIVKNIEKDRISVHHAKFIDGCYPEMDYSAFESKTEFEFHLDDLYEIQVATFVNTLEFSPWSMVDKALSENYCGSTEVVMSPLFFKSYQRFMKEKCDRVCQYPIRVDSSLEGYAVHATPTEQLKRHLITPVNCYIIEIYQKGKWKMSKVISAFEDELSNEIDESIQSFKQRTGIEKGAYRLRLDQEVLKRGTFC